MAAGERIAIALRAGGKEEADLTVLRLAGDEHLSRPFAFEVEVLPADGEPVDPAAFVGTEAQLSLRRPDGPERFVHGECTRAEFLRLEGGVPRYRLRLAPRMARLGLVRRSRIFQGLSAPEIALAVLADHGADRRSALSARYPKREYVAQHRETDLAFFSRILEAEGIWYRFEHAEGSHTVVLCDAPGAFVRGPELPVRQDGQGDGIEHVHSLARTTAIVSDAVVRRDYDFELPGLDLTAKKGKGALEVYEYPGGHEDAADGARLAQARLEELGSLSETLSGGSNAIGLVPGCSAEIEEHGTYAIVSVEHRAEQQRATGLGPAGTVYSNAFTSIDAARPYRPPRRTASRQAAGIETATVVGPAGEEVHVDRHGRVKVQFHWDRDGKRDDRSSAWIRLAQAWAGPGAGASFVPRLGQEVVIRYLDGDPDRPLVTGAVFNGSNPMPVQLPGDKSRSVTRTESSKGGGGANELALEDAQGAEQVSVHAQRDANTEVKGDAAIDVRANASLDVGQDRSKRVDGAQRLEVDGGDTSRVGGNQSLTVAGERRTLVAQDHSETVGGSKAVTVAGGRHLRTHATSAETVGAAAALTIGAAYTVNVIGALNVAVAGLESVQVGLARLEVVGASRQEQVGGNLTRRAGGGSEVRVGGGLSSAAGKDRTHEAGGAAGIEAKGIGTAVAESFALEAQKFTLLVGGKKILELTAGGVELSAANVSIEGTAIALKGASIAK
jgi:type VI secretion system secreted protein VgrG